MEGLTINEAAQTTGWSARMLRYIEQSGLVQAARTPGGYRIYGAPELQRLRTLKELLGRFDVGLSDVAFAARLEQDDDLRGAIQEWMSSSPVRPEDVDAGDWLRFEKLKYERLLNAA